MGRMSAIRQIGVLCGIPALLVGCAARHTFADRVAPGSLPVFQANVKGYTELVDRLERQIGALPDKATAEQIKAHERALAAAIAKERAGARQGDVFDAPEQPAIRQIVRSETRGPQGRPARRAIAEDNPKPGHPAPPGVTPNATYPAGAPLSTVPPTLLLRLPALPKTVEYRFVGKALVLRDARANVIVDYLPDALP